MKQISWLWKSAFICKVNFLTCICKCYLPLNVCQSSISVAPETTSLFSCYLTLIFRIKCRLILFFPLKETLLQVWHTYVSFLGRRQEGGGHAEVSVYFESIWPLEGKEEGVALVVLLYWKTYRMEKKNYFDIVIFMLCYRLQQKLLLLWLKPTKLFLLVTVVLESQVKCPNL